MTRDLERPREPTATHHYSFSVHVQPGDIDPQGHVSNVTVLAWMNRAAVEHSAAVGFAAADYRRLGAMFVVKRHEIDYLHPASEADVLRCETWIDRIEKATAVRRHQITRPADNALIARALNVWAFIDAATGRPTRIPASILAAFGAPPTT